MYPFIVSIFYDPSLVYFSLTVAVHALQLYGEVPQSMPRSRGGAQPCQGGGSCAGVLEELCCQNLGACGF